MHMPWIDDKYVMLLSSSVDRFKVISNSPLQVNFRCPICGDSKKSKTKARGYLFRTNDGSTMYKCHNCGVGKSLRNLLKHVNGRLHQEYVSEVFRQDPTKYRYTKDADQFREAKVEPTSPPVKNPVGLTRLSDLPKDHPAVLYWNERKIPVDRMRDAWWADSYFSWINSCVIPGKFSENAVRHDCGRIVFPFRDAEKNICAYSARSIGGQEPKYVAIKIAEETSAFGMERIDRSQDVYVLEGPIDSMFVPNAVGMGTSFRALDLPKKVMIFDNEPRSPEIVAIVQKAIDAGEKVVIWPPNLAQKDINEMELAGVPFMEIIRARTFKGLQARIEFGGWKKT